ncbi:hypothetical protein PV726_32360 [Streptomyces europaeiscabiei]|uniref:hypothetical protein n=1 Tax=Streptomyces europaeiscabiei TaxID=146819 RepID=UPI0029A54684|nr:hypothetical protein [Streptomyces europaeiscabiei]MDX3694951.1 hypothetical protein [Streptomyces europaeiscabiei]
MTDTAVSATAPDHAPGPSAAGPEATDAAAIPQCHHVIAHWVTDTDREQIKAGLAYAREVGDLAALPLLIARLTLPCQAREVYSAQQNKEGS